MGGRDVRNLALLLLLISATFSTGCGTYKTTYVMRREEPRIAKPIHRVYAHGIGVAGGGGYFFAAHRIFPAWVSWTRPIRLDRDTPEGFYKVEQFHSFSQNTGSAFLSWLIFVNWYHPTHVLIAPAE